MMVVEQVLGGIVLFFITLYLCNQIKREGFDIITFFISIVVLSLWIIVIIPQYADFFLKKLGFYRPFDALIAIIATSALVLTLKIYISTKKMNKAITELVRNEAIKEVEKEKKDQEKKV